MAEEIVVEAAVAVGRVKQPPRQLRVAAGANDMTGTTDQMAGGAQAQAREITTVSRTMEAMSRSVREVTETVQRLKLEEQFRELRQQAQIPGFRPGKAPRAIYERTYGSEHLRHEAAEDEIALVVHEEVAVSRVAEPIADGIQEFYAEEPVAGDAEVERPDHIRARWLDEKGKPHEENLDGLLAVCLQHEMDHLEGILFIDHLSRLKREMVLKKLAKQRKEQGKKAA